MTLTCIPGSRNAGCGAVIRNLPDEKRCPKSTGSAGNRSWEHQKAHLHVVEYVNGLYEQSKQHFNAHNLSMLLIDDQGYVIKNYAMPFFQRVI